MKLTTKVFGSLDSGEEVKLFILSNDNHITVKIINYGGIITSIEMPDKDGKLDNIVCGFDKLEDYLSKAYLDDYPYFGAIIGRNANRISKGKLTIGTDTYQLAPNNDNNHLHGGLKGFDKQLWDYRLIEQSDMIGVELRYTSPHLEENYPGRLQVICTYTLNNNNELTTAFSATTDQSTIVNLTNHSYFNLTGGQTDILSHELQLESLKITETDKQHIPSGKIISVKDAPQDFHVFKPLGKDLDALPTGYDNNFVLRTSENNPLLAAILRDPYSRRQVSFYTTQPGIQLYTGYWIPTLNVGGERKFGPYSGVALETQHYPDATNHPNFPSTILTANDTYREQTIWKFELGK